MEPEKQQTVHPPAQTPAPAAELKAPAHPPQPRPAVSTQPMMPTPRPWPVAFTPMKPVVEMKSVTPPRRKKQCNCRNSHCLKLYCECFAAGLYCDGCNCKQCGNTVENEKARQEAINSTKLRNPKAFQPKIENVSTTPSVRKDTGAPSLPKHNKGCHCKKSVCLKKYCECFQANILCSKNCKCVDCKNFEGSEELKAIIEGENASDRQAANVSVNGATGSSGYKYSPVRRKRHPEDPFGSEANHMDASQVSSSTELEGGIGYPSKSKMVYKSPLANTIHPTDLNDLANHLVIVCKKASEAFLTIADNKVEMEVENGIYTNADLNTDKIKSQEVQKAVVRQPDVATCIDQRNGGDPESPCVNTQEDSRPASPGTQALMCYEQGTTFGTDYSSSFPGALHDQDTPELDALQEKTVLTGFRDYLRLLITRGKINASNSAGMTEANTLSESAMELEARRNHGVTASLDPPKAAEEPIGHSENVKTSEPSASNS
uniref:Uncharacterized protein n=1 Tax=Avena sativa TaxID=4498 RepID=A0ACD6A0N7_AVESA